MLNIVHTAIPILFHALTRYCSTINWDILSGQHTNLKQQKKGLLSLPHTSCRSCRWILLVQSCSPNDLVQIQNFSLDAKIRKRIRATKRGKKVKTESFFKFRHHDSSCSWLLDFTGIILQLLCEFIPKSLFYVTLILLTHFFPLHLYRKIAFLR